MKTDIELEALITDRIRALFNQKPLTPDQIVSLNEKHGYCEYGDAQGRKTVAFVRDIEKIHGIKDPMKSKNAEDTTKQDYEKDILILALRLLGEDPKTLSPEVAEVMMKYEDKVKSVLAGEHVYEL